mmetsp:Transcript_9666/g.20863  ORF Transcript_9666/g.20863 Transcript_9666/m.20863 type:complete len:104 (+) Transcript_9666:266-577(+)
MDLVQNDLQPDPKREAAFPINKNTREIFMRWMHQMNHPELQLATNYSPETGQFVCPAHPMQNPHLRAGVIRRSDTTSGLSRPPSKPLSKLYFFANDGEAAFSW